MKAALASAWLRHLAERLSWPGVAGLILCAAALAGAVAIQPREADNVELRERITAMRSRLAERSAAVPQTEAHALARLPGGEALLPLVAAIHGGARQHRIALDQGEYVWQREAGGQAARYRISFPARGTYPQLRGWIAALVTAWPGLVLEEFDLRREDIGSATVEARVRLVLRTEERS